MNKKQKRKLSEAKETFYWSILFLLSSLLLLFLFSYSKYDEKRPNYTNWEIFLIFLTSFFSILFSRSIFKTRKKVKELSAPFSKHNQNLRRDKVIHDKNLSLIRKAQIFNIWKENNYAINLTKK